MKSAARACVLFGLCATWPGCRPAQRPPVNGAVRADGAARIGLSIDGSRQNPAWSPDGGSLLFTRFRNGYNAEPADLLVVDLQDKTPRTLVSDGSGNVNLPGSAWNAVTRAIVFSSSRAPHDEVFLMEENGAIGDERRVTDRDETMAFEPSLSPDGQWVVFESHAVDVADHGVIVKYKLDGSQPYQALTDPNDDCRQPNWSPVGDLIVYQKLMAGQWDIWLTDPEGTTQTQLTRAAGDKTDASFSPDGRRIVYSSDEGGLEFANLFIIALDGTDSLRLTRFAGYDGAPSWSPDGRRIAFESCSGDPDESAGTTLWVIDAPER